jgi:hypothetical protein
MERWTEDVLSCEPVLVRTLCAILVFPLNLDGELTTRHRFRNEGSACRVARFRNPSEVLRDSSSEPLQDGSASVHTEILMSLDYYVSERFIHDDLVQRAQATVELLYSLWKKRNGKIDPLLLTWPAEPVKDDSGQMLDGVCGMELPTSPGEKNEAIRKLVQRTKAYALFLADRTEDHIKCILETPHGTRSWTIPIRKSGNDEVLGEARVADDKECLGLIWRPVKGVA